MGNVLNLKDKHISRVEEKANEIYGAVRLGEDSYIIPSNVANTDEIDESFKLGKMYRNISLIENLKKIVINEADFISVSCKKILEGDRKIIEIVNLNTVEKDEGTVEVEIESSLLYEEREELLNLLAYLNKDKSAYFTFYIHYNFKLLEGLVAE